MDRLEIEKILLGKYLWTELVTKELTNDLTALIIKWLESKKLKLINENNPMLTDNPFENSLRELRNQLLIELIGELK
jgi:hypothetical protein